MNACQQKDSAGLLRYSVPLPSSYQWFELEVGQDDALFPAPHIEDVAVVALLTYEKRLHKKAQSPSMLGQRTTP